MLSVFATIINNNKFNHPMHILIKASDAQENHNIVVTALRYSDTVHLILITADCACATAAPRANYRHSDMILHIVCKSFPDCFFYNMKWCDQFVVSITSTHNICSHESTTTVRITMIVTAIIGRQLHIGICICYRAFIVIGKKEPKKRSWNNENSHRRFTCVFDVFVMLRETNQCAVRRVCYICQSKAKFAK